MGIARGKGISLNSKGAKALSGQGVPGSGERGQSNRGAAGIHVQKRSENLVKTAYRHVYSLWPPRILILCCGKFVIMELKLLDADSDAALTYYIWKTPDRAGVGALKRCTL
jgi:hypothetical protein